MRIQKITDNNLKIALVVSLVAFAVFGRMMPHPPNFTPVAAAAIFGGAMLPRRWAVILPLIIMMISDYFIGFHSLTWLTWGCFAIIALASNYFVKRDKPYLIIGASIAGSMFFYLITNFGVWMQGVMYPMNIQGLINCYYMALPFLRNTILGDLAFTILLFAIYALVVQSSRVGVNKTAKPL